MNSIKYRNLSYEEKTDICGDENYDVLVGPDDFECILGEPEDRTWGRDGKRSVARLNAQHVEIERLREVLEERTLQHRVQLENSQRLTIENERLRAECSLYLQERQAIRDLFPACLDEYGPTLLEAVKLFIEKEDAK